ncbi:ion transport protein [Chloropicon primus]|uniref:Ion transport protein n=1 Tax=Chloropicon primus TaxID=1764295 RepID=A0A5B8MM39_9CHLO|nr:ion transport protein [Chloropicon primus]UPR00547.1 ion transport protein [Chloropicon primus]|eukprot:QDZ21331.1 ion transport protein [Chloropicon primus]
MSAIHLMVDDMSMKFLQDQQKKKPPLMFHPYSVARNYWDYMLIVLVAYTAAVIPWNVAFQMRDDCDAEAPTTEEGEELGCIPDSIKALDILVDVLFWLDILVNFRTAYVDNKRHTIFDQKQVALHYAKGWFTLDFIGTFPFELVAKSIISSSSGDLANKDIMYLRLLKLPRIIRAARLVKKLDIFTSNKTIRVLKLIFLFLLLGHWVGCIWYFVGSWQAENVGANIFTGDFVWIQRPLLNGNGYDRTDVRTKYTAAVYWALTTMTSVGYGDIVPLTNIERYYTIFVQLLGAICTAVIFGNVGAALISHENALAKNSERVQTINEILDFHDLPDELLDRIKENINYMLIRHRGLDSSQMLNDLPGNLRTDLLVQSMGTVISSSHMFKKCKSQGFIRTIVSHLRPEAYCPDDVIYYQGECSKHLYFIETGSVKLLFGKEMFLLAVLKEKDHFGETELFSPRKRMVTVQAITFCDVHCLLADDLETTLKMFKECQDNVMEFVQSRRKAFEVLATKRGSRSFSISDAPNSLEDYQEELDKYAQKIQGDTKDLNTENDAQSRQNRNLEIVYKALEKIKDQMKYVKQAQTKLGEKLEEYESMQAHPVNITPATSPAEVREDSK